MDEPAKAFAEMADRIVRMNPAEFAGAAVIVPRDGEPIIFLLQDPNPKAAQFWSGVASRVEVAAALAQKSEAERELSPFGMRR